MTRATSSPMTENVIDDATPVIDDAETRQDSYATPRRDCAPPSDGEAIMAGAVLCMAFYNVWSRRFIVRSSALGFLCVGMGAGAAVLIVVGLLTGRVAVLANFNAAQWTAGLWQLGDLRVRFLDGPRWREVAVGHSISRFFRRLPAKEVPDELVEGSEGHDEHVTVVHVTSASTS
jgi:hypothetical protein